LFAATIEVSCEEITSPPRLLLRTAERVPSAAPAGTRALRI